jgi:Mrp family chromosome partitioning ATPase
MSQDQESNALSNKKSDIREPARASAGSVATVSGKGDSPMFSPSHAEQLPAEFVHLYTAIESHFLNLEKPSELALNAMAEEGLSQDRPYILGVSSAVGSEGKTTTAMHLALAMAKNSYKRICLMDFSFPEENSADLGHRLGIYPATEDGAGIDADSGSPLAMETAGIVDVLEETARSVPTFQMADPDNLTIVPGGRVATRPARIARSPRIGQILSSARHAFDVIIVDMPAVATEYALPLARHMDGVMLVVHAGATPRDIVQRAIELLGQERVVGVALNRYKSSVPDWLAKTFNL